jgi:hypothetical protein
MNFLKRTVPLGIAFVLGVVMALRYYVPSQASEDLYTRMSDWGIVISGFARFLGIASIMNLHWSKMRRRQQGWGYSLVVIAAAAATLAAGFLPGLANAVAARRASAAGAAAAPLPFEPYYMDEGHPFFWIFQYMQMPLSSTMFSILAFFIASAAFRTFRAKSPEAVILLLAAVIVMLGRVPVGGLITPWIPDAQERIMLVPNLAAKRGILIGVSLGSIATSLRIIFGIERAYLGGGD